jgi:preprotein translocase subunit SecA
MNTAALPIPGLRWGDYPERAEPAGARWRRARLPAWPQRPGALQQRAEAVHREAASWQSLPPADFATLREGLQAALLQRGLRGTALDQALAYVAEAARRATGRQAYVTQLMAALSLLSRRMVEMATGEGKSLTAALTASVGALAGVPVHVITANDYLVQRDAATFAPLYALLGLGAGCVVAGQPTEQRRDHYRCAVVYVSAREVAFDYLRDRLLQGAGRGALQRRAAALGAGDTPQPVLRGLCMAVIDEADSVLIDEAQMPLVLSREVRDAAGRAFLWQAWTLSARLAQGTDFNILDAPERVALREAGRTRLAALAQPLGPLWQSARHREETVQTALTARHLLHRDRDYVCMPATDPARGDEIAIVDRVTGRIAEGRRWSRGLHALVALKEGCPMPAQVETLAQITFQRFFRRYHHVCGMSGTLREGRAELRALYGCALQPVPLRLPHRGAAWPTRCYTDDAARRRAVVERAAALSAAGRPVLIGCDSVAATQAMAQALQQAGIAHQVLHARLDAEEAAIVARAGRSGQVTVATNMAGRGTDIVLDAQALAAGGLHVLSCQRNGSRRLDRQLAGRAARHGEPGSHECWLALASDVPASAPRLAALQWLARWWPGPADAAGRVALAPWLAHLALRLAQHAGERRQARQRRRLFQSDLALDAGLCFTGPVR